MNDNGMPNPLAPLAALAQNAAATLNTLAPHNVLGKLMEGKGITERRDAREGSRAAERAADATTSRRAGLSYTGKTPIF